MISLDLLVKTLKSFPLRGGHVLVQLVPIVDLLVEAKLQVISVTSNAVVTTSLNVEGGQVESIGIVLGPVQVVLDVGRHEGIAIL